MAKASHQFTTPVGRLIGGSVYNGKTEDYDGNPLVVKTGANKGQPRVDFSFGVAFPKTPGATHWAQEPWLRPVYDLAFTAFVNGEPQRHDFAWKITDGDSTIPKKGKNGAPGKRPCDLEGHPGHWVVWFSSGQAPTLYNANGTQQLIEPNAIKAGYYIQVCGTATDNTGAATPGIYFNHSMVALAGFGPIIASGPDVSTAGFGQGVTLPPGASTTPAAGLSPVPPALPGAPPGPNPMSASPVASVGANPGYAAPAAGMPPPPPPSLPPVSVVPSQQFVQVLPAPPAPPSPPAARQVCDAAGNRFDWAAMQAQGWNEGNLAQGGYVFA